MFHLLILAIIETLYIDIQIFVYLNDGKTIIFGKASFYHSFHCKIVDSMKVCQNSHLLFYAQSPDFHKLGLCYNLKILYL